MLFPTSIFFFLIFYGFSKSHVTINVVCGKSTRMVLNFPVQLLRINRSTFRKWRYIRIQSRILHFWYNNRDNHRTTYCNNYGMPLSTVFSSSVFPTLSGCLTFSLYWATLILICIMPSICKTMLLILATINLYSRNVCLIVVSFVCYLFRINWILYCSE